MIPKSKQQPTGNQRKKPLNAKQKIIRDNAWQRQKAQNLVFAWQERIFSKSIVPAELLQQAAAVLQPQTFDEIVEERAVQDWCGYPLCDKAPQKNSSRYHISLSQRKVYDQTELASFCSNACMQKAKYFRMQLAEDPVWTRNVSVVPRVHIVSRDQDLKSALEEEQTGKTLEKTGQQIRQDYVQKLLRGGVETNTPNVSEAYTIVERDVSPAPTVQISPRSHNVIEGYEIELTKDRKKPTTMILKKPNQTQKPAVQPAITNNTTNQGDATVDEVTVEDMMETMMMLKRMNMDEATEQEKSCKPATVSTNKSGATTSQPETKTSTRPSTRQRVKQQTPTEAKPEVELEAHSEAKPEPKTEIKPKIKSDAKSDMKAERERAKTGESQSQEAKVIKIVVPEKTPKKKTKQQPVMSLFGKIWTVTDRLATRTTRRYLESLEQGVEVDVQSLLSSATERKHDQMADMRSQIFSERILETYSLVRAQIGIQDVLERDFVDLIRTFQFTDASIVALNTTQAYFMTLVLFKALADTTIKDKGWKTGFEACCAAIGESRETVDECVRVLRHSNT